MSDKTMTYRIVVKEAGRQMDCYATFMPKPISGVNGSGMHVHQSLFQGESNLFYDINDRWGLTAGYRMVEGGVDIDEVYKFAWFQYAVVSGVFRF